MAEQKDKHENATELDASALNSLIMCASELITVLRVLTTIAALFVLAIAVVLSSLALFVWLIINGNPLFIIVWAIILMAIARFDNMRYGCS